MPQLAAAFGVWVGGLFVGTGTIAGISTAVIAANIAYFAATGAIYYGLSVASAKLAAKDLKDQRDFALSINVRGAAQPQIVIYGEAVVGSLLCYVNTKRIAGSSDDYELHFVDCVASHPCEDVVALYFDNEYIPASDINWTFTGSPPSSQGVIDGGVYGVNDGVFYAVTLEKRLGNHTLAPVRQQVFADITSDFKGLGLTYVTMRLQKWSDSTTLWATRGSPGNRRFQVKGKNNIYDPRLEFADVSTYGAHVTNPDYAAWTNNNVLCIADFMRTYCKVADDRFNWTDIAVHADLCDVLVVVPPTASPTHYEKRYTLNGGLSLGESCWDTLQGMLSSCMGHLVQTGGVYSIHVGVYNAATVTLTEDDIVGSVSEETHASSTDRYNAIRGIYINKLDAWQEMPFYSVESSAYATDDGDTLWKDISLPFTTGEYEAQRIAFKHVLQSRNDYTLTVPLRWTGLQITPGTVVDITYDGMNKIMRCIGWRMGGEYPFSVVLKEDSSASWADPSIGQYTVRNAAGVITYPSDAVGSRENVLPNLLPQGYADFEHIDDKQLFMSFTEVGDSGDSGISTEQAWLGRRSIKLHQNSTALNSSMSVTLSGIAAGGGYGNIPVLPARRYLFIVSVYVDSTTFQAGHLRPYLLSFTENIYKDWELAALPIGEWTRIAIELDATATTSQEFSVRLSWISDGNTSATDPVGYIDGAALIDVTARPDYTETNFPKAYMAAGGSTFGAYGLDGGGIILPGEGDPEGAVAATVGSLYLRTDGGASTTLYVKTSGGSTSTGWSAK